MSSLPSSALFPNIASLSILSPYLVQPALCSSVILNPTAVCKTVQRKSYSAPARLASTRLSECIERAKDLTTRVVKLSQKAREERKRQDIEHNLVDLRILGQAPLCKSKSLVDLRKVCMEKEVLGEGLIMEGENILKKIRTCHQCHRPINDPVHEGIQSGFGVCTLDHWGDCLGGIKEGKDTKNKVWAACPDEISDDSTLSQISLDDDDDDDVQEE